MRPGPLALILLGGAIVAAFLRALDEQRARQLRRLDELGEEARPLRPGAAAGGSPGEEARRLEGRSRLWRGLFYVCGGAALAAVAMGW